MNPLRKIRNRLKHHLDGHMREILSKGAVAFLLKIIGAGLAFAFHVTITRTLGADGSGLYFLALTIITLVAVVGRLGMDNSVTRFVAAHASVGEWHAVKGVFRHAITITVLVAGLLTLGTYALASSLAIYVFKEPDLAQPLEIMSLSILPLACLTIISRALQGLKNIRDALLIQSVLIPGIATIIIIFFASTKELNIVSIAYVIAASITLLFGIGKWHISRAQMRGFILSFPFKKLVDSGIPLLGAMLIEQLALAIPVLLLGYWASSADVGLFSAASRTANLISLVLVAANSIIAPKMAAIYKSGDIELLEKITIRSSLLLTGMALPSILLFVIAPEWVLSLFGPEFRDAWVLLVIVAIGQIVNVITGSVGFLLMMTGNEKSFFWANTTSLIVCLMLSLILIPNYGGLGAAIAASSASAIVNLMRVRFVYENLGIYALPIPKRIFILRDKEKP